MLLPLAGLVVLGIVGRGTASIALPRWVDVVVVLLVATLGVAGAAWWYAPIHIRGGDWIYHDFPDYCSMVDALARGVAPAPSSRSLLIGRVVAGLMPDGRVFDGMVVGGLVGTFLVMIGIAAWARVVGGRTAAAVAVIVALAVGPLALLARTPTFYPMMDGMFAIAAAATALALRSGRLPILIGAALLVGACGFADARGITWVLALGAATGIAAILGPVARVWRPRRAAGRLGIVLGCLLVTWGLGRAVGTADQCAFLEPQVRAFVQTVAERNGAAPPAPGFPAACPPGRGYCWGWSEPADLVQSVTCVRALMAEIPPDLDQVSAPLREARATHLDPWLPVVLGAAALAVLGLRRRPRALLALVLPAFPFLSAWEAVGGTEVDPRRLAPVLLAVPVLVAVATAVVLGRGRTAGDWRLRVAVSGGAIGLWLVLVSGVVPTGWGPSAPWRRPWAANEEHVGLRVGRMVDPGSGRTACAAALADGPTDLGWDAVMARLRGD